jgi:hypothetical protein
MINWAIAKIVDAVMFPGSNLGREQQLAEQDFYILSGPRETVQDPIYVVLHGNCATAGLAHAHWSDFFAIQGEMYFLEYPGYGHYVESSRSVSSIKHEIRVQFKTIVKLAQRDQRPLYIVGQSIGTGLAAMLACEYRDTVRGLILLSPYRSIRQLILDKYSRLLWPFLYYINDFDTQNFCAGLTCPVLLIHGTFDEIIPYQHSEVLHSLLVSPLSQALYYPCDHNNLPYREIGTKIKEFVASIDA